MARVGKLLRLRKHYSESVFSTPSNFALEFVIRSNTSDKVRLPLFAIIHHPDWRSPGMFEFVISCALLSKSGCIFRDMRIVLLYYYGTCKFVSKKKYEDAKCTLRNENMR